MDGRGISPLRAACYSGFSNLVTAALILSILGSQTGLGIAALLVVGCFLVGFCVTALLIGYLDGPHKRESEEKVFQPGMTKEDRTHGVYRY